MYIYIQLNKHTYTVIHTSLYLYNRFTHLSIYLSIYCYIYMHILLYSYIYIYTVISIYMQLNIYMYAYISISLSLSLYIYIYIMSTVCKSAQCYCRAFISINGRQINYKYIIASKSFMCIITIFKIYNMEEDCFLLHLYDH